MRYPTLKILRFGHSLQGISFSDPTPSPFSEGHIPDMPFRIGNRLQKAKRPKKKKGNFWPVSLDEYFVVEKVIPFVMSH